MKVPRIAVIGDCMIDIDLHCSCERMCQEGPWPVLKVEREERRPGGAGNVAHMVESLGCRKLLLGQNATIKKRRLFVDGKLIGPRVDWDSFEPFADEYTAAWHCNLVGFKPDAIIVADHGKGTITAEVMTMLGSLNIPLFVDPVATTPNCTNVAAIVGSSEEIPRHYYTAWPDMIITKQGKAGIQCWNESDKSQRRVPSTVANAIDPLGAGDQFIAVLTWRRCLGDSWEDAIRLANVAAGLQCMRRGCVPVTLDDLEQAIREFGWSTGPGRRE